MLGGHETAGGLQLGRVAEALDIVDRGDKRRRGDRADAGDRAQASDPLIVSAEALDGLVGIRELAIEVTHDREERGDQGKQCPWERQGARTRVTKPSALPEGTR